MPEWKFVTKYAVVLSIIANYPRITALEIARQIGVTERAVRKLISDLYSAGYINKKKEGRRVKYTVNSNQSLRQETHNHVSVGGLIKTLGHKGNRQQR